jgi:hypothetical protein
MGTSGVRLRSRGTFSRRTRLPNVRRGWSCASASWRPTVRRCSAKGAAGSRRARSGTVLTQWATSAESSRRGLSCERNADDEVRLPGQAIDNRLVRREQRGEERGSGPRPGCLDRGVQLLVDPEVFAAASVGLDGGPRSARGRSSTGAPEGYCAAQ